MEHIGPFLLAAMAVAAVAAAAETATTVAAALPPLPAQPVTMPANMLQPEMAPCMDDLMPCVSVSDDSSSSMLTPCCDAVAEVLKSDPACLCKVAEMTRNNTRKLGSVSNALDGDQQLFAQCKITGASSSICDKGKGGHETETPTGHSSTDSQAKNASAHSRLTEAFRILLLLQILFMFGV